MFQNDKNFTKNVSLVYLTPHVPKNRILLSECLDLPLPLLNSENSIKWLRKMKKAKYSIKPSKNGFNSKNKTRRSKNTCIPPTPYNTTEYICKSQSYSRFRDFNYNNEDLIFQQFNQEHPDATMIGTQDINIKGTNNLPFNKESIIFKESNNKNVDNSFFDLIVSNSLRFS